MNRRVSASDRVVLLLSIIPYLMENGESSVEALAETFDVSPRLMRELIEFLGTAGTPGETGTYQHEDLFDIDWDALEAEGTVRLTQVVAVDGTLRFSPAEHAALIAGLHALTPLLPPDEQVHAQSAAEKLGSTGRTLEITAEPESKDSRVQTIAEAIEKERRLAFSYRDLRGAETERVVEPLGLQQSSSGWYLRAHCTDRDAQRTFIVDGMRRLRVLTEPSLHRSSRESHRSLISPIDGDITAVVRVRESAVNLLEGFALRTLGANADSGWVRAEVTLAYPAAACRLVQMAPGDVIVESPEEARLAVRAWADRALAGYRA